MAFISEFKFYTLILITDFYCYLILLVLQTIQLLLHETKGLKCLKAVKYIQEKIKINVNMLSISFLWIIAL